MTIKIDDKFKKANSEQISQAYGLDQTVQQYNFCDLLEQLEDKDVKFYKCECDTFNDYGSLYSPSFKSVDELREYEFEDAWVNFCAHFIDRTTEEYRFSVITKINSTKITVKYSPTMEEFVNEYLEMDRMYKEALKKEAEEEKQNNEGGYTK